MSERTSRRTSRIDCVVCMDTKRVPSYGCKHAGLSTRCANCTKCGSCAPIPEDTIYRTPKQPLPTEEAPDA